MIDLSDNTVLSPEQRSYLDCMQRGDDFMKIQIYRPAKEWYTRALQLNHSQEEARKKLEECDRLIQYEKKIIIIVVSVLSTAAIVLIYFYA